MFVITFKCSFHFLSSVQNDNILREKKSIILSNAQSWTKSIKKTVKSEKDTRLKFVYVVDKLPKSF